MTVIQKARILTGFLAKKNPHIATGIPEPTFDRKKVSNTVGLKRMISHGTQDIKMLKRSIFLQGLNKHIAMLGTQPLGLRLHHCWCCAGHFYLAMMTKTPDIVHTHDDLSSVCLCVSAPIDHRFCGIDCRVVCGRKGNITCPYLSQWERVGRENGSSSGVCNGKLHSCGRTIHGKQALTIQLCRGH